MAPPPLPDRLTLEHLPTSTAAQKQSGAPQAAQVVLAGDAHFDELVYKIQHAGTAEVSLGKKPAIIIDSRKAYPIKSVRRGPCSLYKKLPRQGTAKLAAVLSLMDAEPRAKPATSQELDMNDPALLALQQNLAEHKQKKESNTTVFVKDSSKLPPPKSGRAALKSKPLAFLKSHRQGMYDQKKSNPRSMPASPSLGGTTPSTSRPDLKMMQHNAQKTAFIHLLAVRAYSKDYITKALHITAEALDPLLEKYRGRLEGSEKHDLSDRGYRELDVWNFPYREEEDRQAAIARAIRSYDRQRISVKENVWQMLLPKEERGKGKILSKLNLHVGTMDRRMRTPQIHVETSKEGNGASRSSSRDADPRSGRLDPSSAKSGVRSSSQDTTKKQRVSEKGAQSKRLFAKDPKKAAQAAKAKDEKAAPSSKPSPAPAPKKAAPKKTTVALASNKIKSAEFVNDSDEDVEMEDFPAAKAKPATATKPAAPAPASRPAAAKLEIKKKLVSVQRSSPPKEKGKEAKQPAAKQPVAKSKAGVVKKPATASTLPAKPRLPESSPKALPMARSLSHKRSNSSPKKPSPLGSSPPTNASDLEADQGSKSSKSSSSSNSPLMVQRRDLASASKIGSARPLAVGNSDRALKRKANDLDSDVHVHPPTFAGAGPPRKRQQTSTESSLAGDSSDNSDALQKSVEDSLRFRKQLDLYTSQLKEVSKMDNPPLEKVEKLRRLYEKLRNHKAEIWRTDDI